MTRIARRRLLKLSGTGAVAAATGGMAGILARGRAPALAQEISVHWLRWTDFVPASDALLKGAITQECKKATGITLKLETVNANDLQVRITSAIQSGAGADIIMAFSNWGQLHAESLADSSDVAEELGKAQGGYYDVSRQVATVGNKWIGVPWTAGGGLMAYRKSWLEEAGAKTFPETWDTFREAGKKLKAKGRPYGQTAGHTFGDAPGWWYPYLRAERHLLCLCRQLVQRTRRLGMLDRPLPHLYTRFDAGARLRQVPGAHTEVEATHRGAATSSPRIPSRPACSTCSPARASRWSRPFAPGWQSARRAFPGSSTDDVRGPQRRKR